MYAICVNSCNGRTARATAKEHDVETRAEMEADRECIKREDEVKTYAEILEGRVGCMSTNWSPRP